jgi:hypothetical protein
MAHHHTGLQWHTFNFPSFTREPGVDEVPVLGLLHVSSHSGGALLWNTLYSQVGWEAQLNQTITWLVYCRSAQIALVRASHMSKPNINVSGKYNPPMTRGDSSLSYILLEYLSFQTFQWASICVHTHKYTFKKWDDTCIKLFQNFSLIDIFPF